MAARNPTDLKRFVHRSPDKINRAYLVPKNESRSYVSSKIIQSQTLPSTKTLQSSLPMKFSPTPQKTYIDMNTPRTETTPVRRVVVVRNTKNPQVKREPVDLGKFGQPDSPRIAPIVSDGHTSIYLMRRSIAPSKPVD
ncbi:unnamed protein product [Rotaria sordida]|uniref:Uncharacterized protein n=1 Tax=Rotaria sordida TaxID=392033 RepID=A0A814URD0_9BILA|nr:unnamed protein product [Rotaria sordida]CAF1496748.1 unnamed protein product [Rotaria sordida]CAF3613274.1 unnamed protein product [Rotaria sordida]CAF3886413.1 unnamed protein product [Rotaria sordida]